MNNSTKGWICLHRSLLDCEIWASNESFDIRSAWIDLLLLCNHQKQSIIFNSQPMDVERGQYLTSLVKLADRWHWDRKKVRRVLNLFEKLGMIIRESDNNRTTITIVNYAEYQDFFKQDRTTTSPSASPTTTPQTTKKQCNNIDNNNMGAAEQKKIKTKTPKFVPPTIEEVQSYCVERHNNVDADNFVNFYTSKDWYVGKTQMTDWQAAVRTWEKNRAPTQTEKAKPKNKFNDFPQREYDMDSIERMMMQKFEEEANLNKRE